MPDTRFAVAFAPVLRQDLRRRLDRIRWSDAVTFEVVMPARPGFGYSARPTRPAQVWAEDVFHRLMTEHLGHRRYLASGTDIGAGVATRLALKHPEALQGIHLSAVADPVLTPASPPLGPAEIAFRARAAQWEVYYVSY